jgi:hypothetical protein
MRWGACGGVRVAATERVAHWRGFARRYFRRSSLAHRDSSEQRTELIAGTAAAAAAGPPRRLIQQIVCSESFMVQDEGPGVKK